MENEDKKGLLPSEISEETKKIAEEEKKEGETEVTSIAKEEEKDGKPVKLSKEDMLQLAFRDYIGGLKMMQAHFRKLSKKGMSRLLIALLQLPQENQKVALHSKEERFLFGIGQRVQNARFTIILNHVDQELKNQKQEKEQQETTKEIEEDERTSDSNSATSDDSDSAE